MKFQSPIKFNSIKLVLKEQWGILSLFVLGNALVSLAELFLFLLLQPFLGIFFSKDYSSAEPVDLKRLLPEDLQNWAQFSWLVSFEQLKLYIVWGIVIAGVVRACGTYAFNYYLQFFMLKVTEMLRAALIKNVLQAPYLRIQRLAANEWMSRVLNDTRLLQVRGAEVFSSLFRDSSRIFIVLFYLISQNWKMTILIAALSPILAWMMGRAGRLMSTYAEHFQRMLARMAQLLLEMRSRFEFIKAQKGEVFENKRFSEYNEGYFSYMRRTLPIRSLFAPLIEWSGVVLICSLVLLGFVSGDDGMSGRGFIAYFAVLAAGLKSIKNLAESITKYGETKGALNEVLSFSEEMSKISSSPAKSASDPKPTTLPLEIYLSEIAIELGGAVVVEGKDLTIPPGRVIAVVGESGGGKSSFLRCLAGLIPPSRWRGNTSWDSLSSASNFVSQTPFLFSGPLKENLLYGLEQPNITREQIQEVLRSLGLSDFVDLLDQEIMRDRVSGGQLQRLTIARALLRNKSILLLDEVTSALDLNTEEMVVRSLQKIVKDQKLFCFFVTHRHHLLSLFEDVWRVENGRILR